MARRRKRNRNYRGRGQSIHPRVVKGRTKFKKVNTAKRSTGDKQRRTLAALEAQLEEQPYNKVVAARIANLTKQLEVL